MLHRRHGVGGGERYRGLRRRRAHPAHQGRRQGRRNDERQLRRLQIRQARREFRRLYGRDRGKGPRKEIHPGAAWRQRQSRRNQIVAMPDPTTPLIMPGLANVYLALASIAEALLRVIVGLALVPHGLRMTFGCFSGTGLKVDSLKSLAGQLDQTGYRPGRLWAPAIAVTELVLGPLLPLGLFTRPAAVPIFIFLAVSNVEPW